MLYKCFELFIILHQNKRLSTQFMCFRETQVFKYYLSYIFMYFRANISVFHVKKLFLKTVKKMGRMKDEPSFLTVYDENNATLSNRRVAYCCGSACNTCSIKRGVSSSISAS